MVVHEAIIIRVSPFPIDRSDHEEEASQLSSTDEDTNVFMKPPAPLEPFPYLNTSGMSVNERNALSERLLQESLMIRLAFASLVEETKASFLERGINSTKIHDELKSSNFVHYKTVTAVESVEAVVGFLSEYWGFNDYSILEYLILKLGVHDDRESLDKYKQNLAEFARRRLFECPVRMFGLSLGGEEIGVTVKRVDKKTILYDTTLNQIQIFSTILKKEMDIDGSEMRLICYQKEEGSLELQFGVLSSSAKAVFPLSSEKKEKLASLGVWLVSCGEHIFQQELQVSTLTIFRTPTTAM